MTALVEKMTQGGRRHARAGAAGGRQAEGQAGRPKHFVFQYRPPTKAFNLKLQFRKSEVDRERSHRRARGDHLASCARQCTSSPWGNSARHRGRRLAPADCRRYLHCGLPGASHARLAPKQGGHAPPIRPFDAPPAVRVLQRERPLARAQESGKPSSRKRRSAARETCCGWPRGRSFVDSSQGYAVRVAESCIRMRLRRGQTEGPKDLV